MKLVESSPLSLLAFIEGLDVRFRNLNSLNEGVNGRVQRRIAEWRIDDLLLPSFSVLSNRQRERGVWKRMLVQKERTKLKSPEYLPFTYTSFCGMLWVVLKICNLKHEPKTELRCLFRPSWCSIIQQFSHLHHKHSTLCPDYSYQGRSNLLWRWNPWLCEIYPINCPWVSKSYHHATAL